MLGGKEGNSRWGEPHKGQLLGTLTYPGPQFPHLRQSLKSDSVQGLEEFHVCGLFPQ